MTNEQHRIMKLEDEVLQLKSKQQYDQEIIIKVVNMLTDSIELLREDIARLK